MQRMATSNVFLSGLGGLGVEIAKNIALAGVKSLTLSDAKVATVQDQGCQFFISQADITNGLSRSVKPLLAPTTCTIHTLCRDQE